MIKHLNVTGLKTAKFLLFGLLGLWMASAPSVAALTTNDIDSLIKQHPYYDAEGSSECGPTPSSTLPGSDVPEKVWKRLTSRGLSKIAVAALMGNMQHETAGTWDPRVNNDGHNTLTDFPLSINQAYGLVQWRGGRQTNLVNRANEAGVIPGDLALQLDFVLAELNGELPDYEYLKTLVGDVINSPSVTIESATKVVYDSYEGLAGSIGQGSAAGRTPTALDIFNQYKDLSAGDSTINPNPSCLSIFPSGECPVAAPVWGLQKGQGDQYSASQMATMFGDPGTFGSHPVMDANLVSVDFLGFKATVHKLIAPCLEEVAKEIQASGSTYKINTFGCYRWDIGQLEERSYHTYGIACDLNENTNKLYPTEECKDVGSHDMPPEIVRAFYNHGFTWGGYWCSLKDYMHFEFNGFDPNNPIPQPQQGSETGKKIAQTAIALAWPDGSHGPTPTDAYRKANEIYNKATQVEKDSDEGKPSIALGADCSVFVSVVMRMSGVDPNYAPGARCGTRDQEKYVRNNSDYQIIEADDSNAPRLFLTLQPGDILVANASGCDAGGHTLIWLGSEGGGNNVAQASWSSNFEEGANEEGAKMPFLKNISSLQKDFESVSVYYTIARHK